MRFIYLVLLGLIIFNGVIIAFSDFFPLANQDVHAVNVTDEYGDSYGNLNQGLFGSVWADAISVGGAVFGLAILLGVLAKQVALFAGIGGFIAVLCGLWSATNGIVTNITNYPVVNTLVTIIIIVIGIIAVFSVIEMLNAQGGVN